MTTLPAIDLLPDRVMPPNWQAPIPWRTRQVIRFDVLMHRSLPSMIVFTWVVGLTTLVPFIVATLVLAKVDHRLAALPLIIGGPLASAIILWLNKRLSHRTTGRAASAGEVTALRRHCPPRAWTYVQDSAAHWRQYWPRVPITIQLVLIWQDEAAAIERRAMPPTATEQAANRVQDRAFL